MIAAALLGACADDRDIIRAAVIEKSEDVICGRNLTLAEVDAFYAGMRAEWETYCVAVAARRSATTQPFGVPEVQAVPKARPSN